MDNTLLSDIFLRRNFGYFFLIESKQLDLLLRIELCSQNYVKEQASPKNALLIVHLPSLITIENGLLSREHLSMYIAKLKYNSSQIISIH